MSHRVIMSAFAFAFALTGAAHAAEVKRTIEIKGDRSQVWAKIGGWCAIADWHPVLAKCEETTSGGKKYRVLTTKDGGVIKETMVKSGKASYSYQIDESPLPVANYTASFSVKRDRNDKTKSSVVWSAKFDPKGASEEDAKKVIDGIFKGGLDEIANTYK
ncbi:MAG: SRPBCC family protein [Rhodomicrobiaceae bacterium]